MLSIERRVNILAGRDVDGGVAQFLWFIDRPGALAAALAGGRRLQVHQQLGGYCCISFKYFLFSFHYLRNSKLHPT